MGHQSVQFHFLFQTHSTLGVEVIIKRLCWPLHDAGGTLISRYSTCYRTLFFNYQRILLWKMRTVRWANRTSCKKVSPNSWRSHSLDQSSANSWPESNTRCCQSRSIKKVEQENVCFSRTTIVVLVRECTCMECLKMSFGLPAIGVTTGSMVNVCVTKQTELNEFFCAKRVHV